MAYETLQSLRVEIERGVAFVTIDHPPINLFDQALMLDFHALGKALQADPAVRVAVVQSANPDFFIAHADVTMIQQMEARGFTKKEDPTSFFQAMVDRFRTMPKVTIAKIEGRARGGGSELALSMDMRFAAAGRAVLSQFEVMLGIIPGGTGTQRLPRLLGRGRAMEVILGGGDFTAEQAERYGYVNRALPPDELGPFVEELAYRIASFPAEAIAAAKEAVNAAEQGMGEGLALENRLFNGTVETDAARERMAAFMALGGQTAEVETKDFAQLAGRLGPAGGPSRDS